MTTNIQSANESLQPMKIFEKIFSETQTTTETSPTRCPVYTFELFSNSEISTPDNHIAIGDLVNQWEKNEVRRAALEDARRWAAEEFHGEDGETVRTLRLKKGWSQARLAQELSTSQPHIARIERGTENLSIETCRKLCEALEIDMNGLNEALKRQSAIAQAKQK